MIDAALQTISIKVTELRLKCEEGLLVYNPFELELSEAHPCCCVMGPSGSGKTNFYKSLVRRFVDDWREYQSVDCNVQILGN